MCYSFTWNTRFGRSLTAVLYPGGCYHGPVKIPRALAVAPLLLMLALLAAACVSTENPSGWAAPVFGTKNVYFLEAHDHLGAAPIPGTTPQTQLTWVFPNANDAAQKNIKLQAVYGDPVLDEPHIYFSSFSGGVFALNAKDGSIVWQMKSEISGNVAGGVAVSSSLLAFGTTDGHLYVVNKSDHTTASGWPTAGLALGTGIWTAPIFSPDGNTLYVATMGGLVHAFNVKDHSEAWGQPFRADGAIADMAMLDATHLFVPTLSGHVYSLDPTQGGKVTAHFVAKDWVWTRAAFKAGIAYFGDFSGNLYALDLNSGQLKWEKQVSNNGSQIKATPAISGGLLVVADRSPAVHFVDLTDGTVKNTVPLLNAGTVRSALEVRPNDSYVYLVTTNGQFFRADPAHLKVEEITVGGRP